MNFFNAYQEVTKNMNLKTAFSHWPETETIETWKTKEPPSSPKLLFSKSAKYKQTSRLFLYLDELKRNFCFEMIFFLVVTGNKAQINYIHYFCLSF